MKTVLISRLGVLGLLFSVIISCKTSIKSELTSEQRKAIEDTVRHLVGMVEETVNQHDLNLSFKVFSNDPDFTFSEDGYIKPPKDSLYKIIKPVYDYFPQMSASYDTMRIVVLDKNSAAFTGEGAWSATDLKGNTTKGHLVSTFVFVNRNNK
jgi:hypothetical protein